MLRRLSRRRRLLLATPLVAVLLLAGAGAAAYALTPLPAAIDAGLPAPDTLILDRHGALLADLPHGGVRHDVVPFSAFAPVLRQATLAAEDISFYSNPGIDPLALARAALLDLHGGPLYGGSTITQQLVRNVLLSPREQASRSLGRKLHEALLALKLTRLLSKDDILALYLNSVSYGNLTYGADTAARFYFSRPASDLDLAQAALLAGLPRAPSLYDPLRHFAAARARQLTVLRLMQEHHMISAAQERLAAVEPLHIGSAASITGIAPHWVTYVLGLVADQLGSDRVERGGLIVRTTLDSSIQLAALEAVQRQMATVARDHNGHDAAVVATAPDSGEILAMVGSADPTNRAIDGAYNVALAPRQPGSAIKPFTYLAALDRWSPGARNLGLTAASLLDDVPSTFYTAHSDGTSSAYRPLDYDGYFLGRVPLRVALGSSLNVPAVETLQRVGIARMLSVAHAAGITTMYRADRYGPALTLGGGEVTLLDLTSAYATIADGGLHHVPRAILSVTDTQGHPLGTWAPVPPRQAFGPRGPQLAALMTDILSDDGARLPAFGANSPLVLPDRPAAAKTGTTTDWHDNWTVGYTPDLVAGVWVGNADNTPMIRITGITGAAPIWHDLMTSTLRGVAPHPFALPPGMVRETICRETGLPATTSCHDPADELFIAGTEPKELSAISYQVSALNGTQIGARDARASTPPQSVRGRGMAGGQPLIADPPDGTTYALDPALPASTQQEAVTLSYQPESGQPSAVSHQLAEVELRLLVDGHTVGQCSGSTCTVLWPLQAGRHRLTAAAHWKDRDILGSTIQITVGSSQ